MRTAIAVTAVTVAGGFGAGWLARGAPRESVRIVYRDRAATPPVPLASTSFPDYPKPPVEVPIPDTRTVAPASRPVSPIPGAVSALPSLEGPIAPLEPEGAATLPVADLKADESLARRTALGAGGEIVSAADAKDVSGKVGRALVAETDAAGLERLRAALRRALGDRAVLSDGGSVGGASAETRKAEDALAALRKRRDAARIDYLPQAPALRDLEEAVLAAERELAALRRASSRSRLNILLRPTLNP